MPYSAHRLSKPGRLVASAALACLLGACGGGGGDDDSEAATTTAAASPAEDIKTIEAVVFADMSESTTLIVQMEPGYPVGPLANSMGAVKVERLGSRPVYLLSFQSAADAGRALTTIKSQQANLNVQFVEPNLPVYTPEQAPGAIGNSVVAIGTGGTGDKVTTTAEGWAVRRLQLRLIPAVRGTVRVAVLDTGMDYTHRDLAPQVALRDDKTLLGYDFVDHDADPKEVRLSDPSSQAFGHGTHVAGIIAATAPRALLMPVRVLDGRGKGTLWTVAKGAVWALDPDGKPTSNDGAAVLNFSLGTSIESRTLAMIMDIAGCADGLRTRSTNYRDAGFDPDRDRCASHLAAVVVAGAGNIAAAPSLWPARMADSTHPGLISVTSSNRYGWLSDFSARDAAVNLAAPGDLISSSYPGHGTNYALMSGTSMAAPWVSGTAALILSTLPATFDNRHVFAVDRIRETTSPLCGTTLRQVDPLAALTGIRTTIPCEVDLP